MLEIYLIHAACLLLGAISITYGWYRNRNSYDIHNNLSMSIGLHLIVQVIVAFILYLPTFSSMKDVEILNGQVTGKFSEKVSCSHSYSCNCRTVSSGSGKNRTTRRVCDTCYEHRYDIDWVVKSTFGRSTIDRINRQGTNEPPRWTAVSVGEPFSSPHVYDNYVLVDPESLFSERQFLVVKYKNLPAYPKVYDYYRVNRVVPLSGKYTTFAADLNHKLNMSLRTVGPNKQVNIIVVVGSNLTDDYMRAIRQYWFNGKKNDVVVLISEVDNKIQNAYVFGWAKNSISDIEIRNALIGSDLTAESVSGIIITNTMKYFVRRSMKEFEYLLDQAVVPMWAVVVSLLLMLGAHIFMHFKIYEVSTRRFY